MKEATRAKVRTRAGGLCEYCKVSERFYSQLFHVEHIIAKSHGGGDELDNLAQACGSCNLHKGPNLSGIDPVTKELTRLFNPRSDAWGEHFAIENGVVLGLTSVGRTTVRVLDMNADELVELRVVAESLGW